MIKKSLATVAVAASVFGATGIAAAPAMAVGGDDEHGTANSANGNGSVQAYGNTTTGGYMSPQIGLINGSFNKFCIPIQQIDVQVPIIGIAVQDLLNSEPSQNCSDYSTQVDGDDPLSHVLSDIPILSENGASSH
ncbi:rodlin [Streptomyces johnsoniae]|uniref:Rodlin n=1 Tax=Streptomyces johnsoniae TaxID=3075532 RepID=A0ABU2S2A7_9ACTN|nr:rodlin [Streptomyces sp. DSM 41886]MDT0441735.1 rodlin [Streptomyces sp. DSM 41886]